MLIYLLFMCISVIKIVELLNSSPFHIAEGQGFGHVESIFSYYFSSLMLWALKLVFFFFVSPARFVISVVSVRPRGSRSVVEKLSRLTRKGLPRPYVKLFFTPVLVDAASPASSFLFACFISLSHTRFRPVACSDRNPCTQSCAQYEPLCSLYPASHLP